MIHVPVIAVGFSAAVRRETGHAEDFLHPRTLEKDQVQIKSGCACRIQGRDLSLYPLFPEAEVGAQHILIKIQVLS